MDRDEIIRMAREAGLVVDHDVTSLWKEGTNIEPFLVHFANLVAVAEREACAKICDSMFDDGGIDKPEPAPFLWFLKRKEECVFTIRERGAP